MKLIKVDNYDELSAKSAEIVRDVILDNPSAVLGLATGSTPEGMYSQLIEMYKNGVISFKNISTVNLDEYYKIDFDNKNSYHFYMKTKFFDNIDIKKENTHIPEYSSYEYENILSGLPKRDIQILGVGENGHIGFNEPSDMIYWRTHTSLLSASTIQANSRFFDNESDIPRYAITMGIGDILYSKKILLLANGEKKKDAIEKLIDSDDVVPDPLWPVTFLKIHPDVTVIYNFNN